MRPDGEALIYVWAKNQQKDAEKTSYIKQDRKNRKGEMKETHVKGEEVSSSGVSLPVHTNRTQFQHQDVLVPWKLKNKEENHNLFLRFYHVFEEGELEKMCKLLDNIEIVKSFYDQGNWCVIIKKVGL